jgi:flavodoxin
MESKSLVVVYSYHHKNTEKVAHAIAKALNAEVKYPRDINTEEIQKYDLVGFGAGIDNEKHYAPILKLAASLSVVQNKKAFIFSTSGFKWKKKMMNDHSALRNILVSKSYNIAGEFNCLGFDTNSIYKYIFGGINKGRPNEKDLGKAETFAKNLVQQRTK